MTDGAPWSLSGEELALVRYVRPTEVARHVALPGRSEPAIKIDCQPSHRSAIGILMSRSGLTPDQANNKIRQLGEQGKTNMSVIAAGIVREAVRRARPAHQEI